MSTGVGFGLGLGLVCRSGVQVLHQLAFDFVSGVTT